MKMKQKHPIGHIRLLGLAALMTTGLTIQAQTTFLTKGHTDIGIDYDNGFDLSIGSTPVENGPETDYAPDEATYVALPDSHTTVPNNPSFSFLGSPGSDVWILPQVQNTNLLFLGFGAEGITNGTFLNNQLTLTLKGVSGPGAVNVYLTDGFGNPNLWFSSTHAPGSDVQTIATGQHTHVNWAFSEPGDYTVTFQADAVLPDSTPTSSGPVDYKFHVVGNPTYLTKGHTDIGIDYDNGFDLSIGSTPVENGPETDYEPFEATYVALPGSHTTVPNNPSFSFLGSPGSDVWILPQVQNTNLLFLGFGAEGITNGTFLNDQLTLTLEGVSGPGAVNVYLTDGFSNPNLWFSSTHAPGSDVQTIATGQHTHVNWAFSEPGDYTVTFQADAVLPDSTPTSSGPVDYKFHVVDTNAINTNPPLLQFTASGTNLHFSWPATNQGWIFLTNSVGLTASNAWFPYPEEGSAYTTNVFLHMNNTQPNVFFRLAYPTN